MNIRLRVKNVVEKYMTRDPWKIANALGIHIIQADLPVNVRGFLVKTLRRKIIMINAHLDWSHQKAAIAHELGHALLHTGYGYMYRPDNFCHAKSKIEIEASEFAIYLLAYGSDIDTCELARALHYYKADSLEVHKVLTKIVNFL